MEDKRLTQVVSEPTSSSTHESYLLNVRHISQDHFEFIPLRAAREANNKWEQYKRKLKTMKKPSAQICFDMDIPCGTMTQCRACRAMKQYRIVCSEVRILAVKSECAKQKNE